MSDRAIIQQVLAGEVEAFARLVDRHYARCARIAVRILGNHEDAEEAIQDAFLRAYRALDSYEHRERFSAWLTRILVNQCRTALARSRRRDAVFADLDLRQAHFAIEAAPDDGAWPELERVLARLPAEQREAIVLRYADDLTYEEMSRITGAGESALKMRVQRAFARLRALLQEVPSV
ncbi:MAG TPA: RNA polymerase sigma factor [Gemmatimonadaceae bacterium]|jgi:RNA polymerase sigma-70 factor (ECF subfamily)|nr:RNA polymerase sigma factor [Gemmatimonadaceae bacterium]